MDHLRRTSRTGSRGGSGQTPAAVHGLLDADVGVPAAHVGAVLPFQTAAQQQPRRPGVLSLALGPSQLAAHARQQLQQQQLRAAESEAAVAMYRLLNPATRLYEPRHEHAARAQPDPERACSLVQAPSRAVPPQAVTSAAEVARQQRPSLSRVRSALQASAGGAATPGP